MREKRFYLDIIRSASVRTDEPSVIYKLTAEAMRKLEKDYSEFAVSFHKSIIRVLASHVIQANAELKLELNSALF